LPTVRSVTVTWEGERLFHGVDTGGQPVDIDGRQHLGAKPSDLLPLALASCSGYDVADELSGDGRHLAALEVTVSYTQQPDPPWTFRRFRLHYRVSGSGFGDADVAAAIRRSVEEKCSVASTVAATAEIETAFTFTPDGE
jgi:putative redox protein